MLLLITLALARPDDGNGMWQYDGTDDVTSLDSANGRVRVWYSRSGSNEVKAGDEDGNGLPDFAEAVAQRAEEVLIFYEEMGLRPPLSDGNRGGSAAMDAYLVDFAGQADGNFAAEYCQTVGTAEQCSGYFQMENDFSGYGYSSTDAAITTLTSHELFHAVQAAYDSNEESWWSEGTATWGERAFDEENDDFIWLCDAYLADPERSLDQPPTGISAWSYGTALWWWFLSNRYGTEIIGELLEATEASDSLTTEMEVLIAAHGGTLGEDWITFVHWNLATGRQSGATESYPFASDLEEPPDIVSTDAYADEHRYYPLGATYYHYEHPGGHAYFALLEDAPAVSFSLIPVNADGDILDASLRWTGTAGIMDLGDLAVGDWYILATNATLAEDSTRVLTCFGSEETVATCLPVDTGDSAPADTGPSKEPEACGCSNAESASAGGAVLLAVMLMIRHRAEKTRKKP